MQFHCTVRFKTVNTYYINTNCYVTLYSPFSLKNKIKIWVEILASQIYNRIFLAGVTYLAVSFLLTFRESLWSILHGHKRKADAISILAPAQIFLRFRSGNARVFFFTTYIILFGTLVFIFYFILLCFLNVYTINLK